MKEKKEIPFKVCKHCGASYRSDKKYCPECYYDDNGEYHGYVPMSEKKVKTIRIIVGTILTVIAIVIIVIKAINQ